MSLPDARMRIVVAHRDLLFAWASVEEQWRDGNAREFKTRVLEPAEIIVRNVANGMEQMEAELAKLRRDCEIEGKI